MPVPARRDIFADLGLTRIINVSGTETLYGAGPVCDEVLAAVAALAPCSVDMRELQQAASRVIAGAMGSEAGMVAHCTAAGITAAVAACMTGEDLGRIHQLPDTTGMKHDVILQRGHCIDYGAPLRQNIILTGAQLVEIGTPSGCHPDELTAAISAQTAAAVYVVSHHAAQTGMIELAPFCRFCRERGIPVIVDAAAEPDPRLFLAVGADLVISSAHKRFAGLTAAIVAGKSPLVRACLAQEKGLGRPMKAGKEAVIATIAAIERWLRLDHGARQRALDARLARAQAKLSGIPGVAATIVPDVTSAAFARLHVELEPSAAGLNARELAEALQAGSPAIIVRESYPAGPLQLDFRLVTDETADAVVEALATILRKHSPLSARPPQLPSQPQPAARRSP